MATIHINTPFTITVAVERNPKDPSLEELHARTLAAAFLPGYILETIKKQYNENTHLPEIEIMCKDFHERLGE